LATHQTNHLRLCGNFDCFCQEMVLGTSFPGENPPRFLSLKPIPLIDNIIA
jgi:hypothetical protein